MNSFFDNISNKISGIFQSSGNEAVLGVDVGSSSIKVVQIQKKNNRAVLQTYGEIALGPYAGIEVGRATKLEVDKLSEAMNDVLKESNVSTKNSALSIPLSSSMVSVIKMPALKTKQLNQMIPLEARKYIPVPISEVALDWFVIPKMNELDVDDRFRTTDSSLTDQKKQNQEQVEVMVVAIHNDTLGNYSSLVDTTGLQSSFFEIEMFSTTRAILDSSFMQPVMIIDIGAGATKVYIAEREVVRGTHIIGRGSQDLTLSISRSLSVDVAFAEKLKRTYGQNGAEKDSQISELIDNIFNPIFANANDVLMKFQKQNHKNITKVLMVGGGSLLNGIVDKAQRYFAVETQVGTPFDKLQTPAFLDPVLQKNGVMFAGAIGLALRKLQEME